jgi:hypothetical protein
MMLEEPDGAILLTGLGEAIIGQTSDRLVYSANKILDILVQRDQMTYDEAMEFYSFNIEGLYAGATTPILMWER